jgi:hypothetical protein
MYFVKLNPSPHQKHNQAKTRTIWQKEGFQIGMLRIQINLPPSGKKISDLSIPL